LVFIDDNQGYTKWIAILFLDIIASNLHEKTGNNDRKQQLKKVFLHLPKAQNYA